MTFTIHTDLTIAAIKGNAPAGTDSFTTQKQLLSLATGWPMERLVAIWNHLPAARPVRRFTDRKTAVTRIWNAIQDFAPAAEPVPLKPAAMPEPEPAAATESETAAADEQAESVNAESADPVTTPVASQPGANAPKKRKKQATQPRPAEPSSTPVASKKDIVLALLRRQEGATMIQLMDGTGWMAHSVRGFLSGQVAKKMGIAVNSAKREDGQRVYRVS